MLGLVERETEPVASRVMALIIHAIMYTPVIVPRRRFRDHALPEVTDEPNLILLIVRPLYNIPLI